MKRKPNRIRKILGKSIFWFTLAIIFEVFSIAFFYGFMSQWDPICGSPCDEWPGITTSETCVAICEPRNGLYLPFFILGLFSFLLGIVFWIRTKKNIAP